MMYQGTNIDGPSLAPEQLNIRGKNLTDLIQERSYLEVVHHIITGSFPSEKELKQIHHFCNQSLYSILNNTQAITLIKQQASQSKDITKTIIQGLLLGFQEEFDIIFSSQKTAYDKDTAYGLFLISTIPVFTSIAIQEIEKENTFTIPTIHPEQSYTENIFRFFFGRTNTSKEELILFESLLVAWHAGFGHLTPSVMGPRVAAGTYASMEMVLITGFTCSGPFHIGASQFALAFLQNYQNDTLENTQEAIKNQLVSNEKIPGFGHPLFKKDPRNNTLLEIWDQCMTDKKHIEKYRAICTLIEETKELQPNIDFITAGILCEFGVTQATLAPSIALFSRASAILAHAKEKKQKPPFGSKSKDARKHLDQLSVEWI